MGASPIWIAPELRSGSFSAKCKGEEKSLRGNSNGFLSSSLEEINSKAIDALASESATSRIHSIECLRTLRPNPEDRKELIQDWRTSNQRGDTVFKAELARLLAKDRSYSLNPSESKLAKEWAIDRQEMVDSIRSLTEKAILLPNSEWKKESSDLILEWKARYGALLRARETFFLSLSPETREAYYREILSKD